MEYLYLDNSSFDLHPEVFEKHHMPDLGLMIDGLDDGLQECAKYNPLGPSRPGIANSIVIKLSTKDIHDWYINVHYHKHFTDGLLMTFGSAHIENDQGRIGGFQSSYEITPTEFEYLNTEDDPCIPEEEKELVKKVNLWDCLEQNHIASKLNCTLPWRSDDKKPLCTEPGRRFNRRKTFWLEFRLQKRLEIPF